MKLYIVLISFFLISCSTSYKGQGPELAKAACQIKQNCGGRDDSFELRYKVTELGGNTYKLVGYAIWDDSEYPKFFGYLDEVNFYFVFLNKQNVVHQEFVSLSGYPKEKLTFEKIIKTQTSINSTNIADYKGTISPERS